MRNLGFLALILTILSFYIMPSNVVFAKKNKLNQSITKELLAADKDLAFKVSLLNAVLLMNEERYIHNMNVPEFVRKKNGQKIKSCANDLSPNYAHPKQNTFAHFYLDIFPWIIFGNCEDDSSSKKQRVDAYSKDMRLALDKVISPRGMGSTNDFPFNDPNFSNNAYKLINALEANGFNFIKELNNLKKMGTLRSENEMDTIVEDVKGNFLKALRKYLS